MKDLRKVNSISPIVKALIASEFVSILFGVLFTFVTIGTESTMGSDKNHLLCNTTLAGWIWLLAFRAPVLSVLSPLLFYYSYEPSEETSRFARFRKSFSDNCIITIISSIITIAAMAGLYFASSKIIIDNFNPDPKKFPPGTIDCSAAKLSQFASDAGINAVGPALFLGLQKVGIRFFNCMKEYKDNRTAVQRMKSLNDNSLQFSRYTSYNTL